MSSLSSYVRAPSEWTDVAENIQASPFMNLQSTSFTLKNRSGCTTNEFLVNIQSFFESQVKIILKSYGKFKIQVDFCCQFTCETTRLGAKFSRFIRGMSINRDDDVDEYFKFLLFEIRELAIGYTLEAIDSCSPNTYFAIHVHINDILF